MNYQVKTLLKGIYNIEYSACGHDFTACISSDGRLFIWGSNSNNKLGLDTNNLSEPSPKVIEILVSIKKVQDNYD
jgi:alpha-tubulin suppressor-like RCC1 family protein